MMVTFVSQCEKKALPRTRRVLDAFANRIGDNTWQTVITEDGLLTVKKMLRQTASKNTAVSCHWIRSRSRSQFLWVVGNRDTFNVAGYVSVNSTKVNELKVDETPMMNEIVYANSQRQLLAQHLFAVGMLASRLIEHLIPDNNAKLKQATFVAGCLHDIGKLDPEFRRWLDSKINKTKSDEIELTDDGVHVDKGKFSFESHPRHNEISLWLLQFCNLKTLLVNTKLNDFVEHGVFWHHAKPVRKEAYIKLNDIHRKLKSLYKDKGLIELVEHANIILSELLDLIKNSSLVRSTDLTGIKFSFDEDIVSDFRKISLPDYKQYDPSEDIEDYVDQINVNAKANLVRTCVISADRIISALSAEQLQDMIISDEIYKFGDKLFASNSELIDHIDRCIQRFDEKYPNSERNQEQARVAESLLEVESVAVLNGPAGCGKTKIALQWAKLSDAKKIIWVCPRVQVCEGLFKDLTSSEYLPDAKVEICTGEIKETHQGGDISVTIDGQEFSGDIVLTTIDQVINSITTHTNITALVDFMRAHVVFDEYHEYIPMPGFNLLFAELVKCKQLKGHNAKTLLVSATPNYAYVQQVLDIYSEDIFDCKSYNDSKYQIAFHIFDEEILDHQNPLYSLQSENSIVISNTATTAQQAYVANQSIENAIVFHGKFKVSDKKQIFEKVYQSFKRNGDKHFDVLRSGPIVQASLNITCKHMVTEFTVAENWLQRLGRLDRFGENSEINKYTTAIPKSIIESKGKNKGNCARFLNSCHGYQSAYAWYQFLHAKELNEPFNINSIYQIYKEFYQSTKALKAIEQDLLSALKNGVNIICAKVHDPISFIKKSSSEGKKKLKKTSLRGDSRFVQMAKILITSGGKVEFKNEYVASWQETDNDFGNCYTESLEIIRNSGLIDYVAKKQERITPGSPIKGIPVNKMALRKQVLEGAAVDPENPIYLSYTPNSLSECLGEHEPDPASIYYVTGFKQVVGAMPLNKLKIN